MLAYEQYAMFWRHEFTFWLLILLCAVFFWQEFDNTYGPGWQCIVGTDFGSFVTHCHGCFIYFCLGNLAVLLFRGAAGPEAEAKQPCAALEAVKA